MYSPSTSGGKASHQIGSFNRRIIQTDATTPRTSNATRATGSGTSANGTIARSVGGGAAKAAPTTGAIQGSCPCIQLTVAVRYSIPSYPGSYGR